MQAYRVDELRAAEAAVKARVPEGSLMQRAAAGLATVCARVLQASAGGVSGRRVLLLVGAGDNGGDALWAGARLAGRGAAVVAVPLSDTIHEAGLAALLAAGGRTVRPPDAARELARAELVVDGIVGLGGKAGLRAPAGELLAAVRAPVVAVDLPSGVDPDTGEVGEEHVRADVTVSFGAVKPCLLLPPAAAAAGEIVQVDIGLAADLPAAPFVERLTTADAGRLWPVPVPDGDKYRRGVLGVVAGSAGYPGAAVLCTAGAMRAGLGMVRYVGPDSVAEAVRTAWPEAVSGWGRVQAWVIGPGTNPEVGGDSGAEQTERLRRALDSGEPCVLDAGALSLLERVDARRGAQVLLTPHAGELARLLGAERSEVEARPYRHAARAARQTGATVLLKGATTLVVRPDGTARSQHDGPPWLATAGAGDVLAGIAGALLSGGLDAADAGAVATLVHGRAAALASGGGPITALDVAHRVPGVVAGLVGAG